MNAATEWIAAIGALLVLIALFPRALAAARRSARKGGAAAGIMMAAGLAFGFLTDARKPEIAERAAKKDDRADREHGGE